MGLNGAYLAEGEHALLGSSAAAAHHDEVVVDLTVMREATDGRDRLLGDIVRRGAVVLDDATVLGVDALRAQNTKCIFDFISQVNLLPMKIVDFWTLWQISFVKLQK